MSKVEEFEELRPLLFSISYRILGSVGEAEDAVQETWLRFDRSSTRPASTKAFLSATVTRISIDVLRSARVRREEYVGPWFPEPLLNDPYQDPARSAELADSVSMAALLLLERLGPLERAVFLLREVFAFGFDEIASAVGRSEAACRQLLVRARRHMETGRPRFAADRREQQELAARFFDAMKDGDVGGLRNLLAADARLVGDAGGKAPHLARAVTGADRVARVLGAALPWLARVGVTFEPSEVNGRPGAVFRDRDGRILHVLSLEMLDGRVQTIRGVINPDKLGHLGPVADAWAINREVKEARARRPNRPRAARPTGLRTKGTRVGGADGVRVVLVGGTSNTGKSTVARAVADRLGFECLSTDGLARHPGRPWRTPEREVPAHVAEHYGSLTVDELTASVLDHYKRLWPRIERLITEYAADGSAGAGLVLEGAALWPTDVAGLAVPGTAAVWLTADDAVLRARIRRAGRYNEATDHERLLMDRFLARSARYQAIMLDAVAGLGLDRVDAGAGGSVAELADAVLAAVDAQDSAGAATSPP
ncbi:RNA polymerase sigma-70 factor [Actinorugispora endophytica]|uniref:RNA polymerase sigma-70 factor (TIGR02957 family) n=1 Tax=Actinorugispora endophytica TaxID=1605990 RepID=A0A4R6UWD7_9ACTN|nr:RNA polymerase sigma-70 factor (TIGR02957 family) [Actinorugispora endophytica]